MIDPTTEAVFPNNVVECLAVVFPGMDSDVRVLTRPLRSSDPNYSVGVYGTLWTPNDEGFEMGHHLGSPNVGPNESTLQMYQIGIQSLIKDGDAQKALAIGSILNRRIRAVLYRNDALRLALGSLYITDGVSTERMMRWGIRSQRYMSNDIEGTFVYVSVLDMWLETEQT